MVVILVGEMKASASYVAQKEKFAAKAGIKSEVRRFTAEISEEEILTEIDKIKSIDESNFSKSISKEFFITKNMIIWSIRNEMSMKLEDILARRTRCPFLDVNETLKIAPKVSGIMAKEMNKNKEWVNTELKNFIKLALKYQKI